MGLLPEIARAALFTSAAALLIVIVAACRPGPVPRRRVNYLVYPELASKRERQRARRAGRGGS